jgi:disulfide bond formation protein DsbB
VKEFAVSVHNHIDPSQVTGQVSLASAATSLTLLGLSVSEWGVIISAVVALATFGLHVWYTVRKDKRAREIHKRRIESGDLDGSPE